MPEWLLKSDNYISRDYKEGFIDKSISAMLKVLGKLSLHREMKGDSIKFSSIILLPSILLMIILVAISRSIIFLYSGGVAMLLILSLLKRDEILLVLKRCLGAAAFAIIILLPSIYFGNVNNSFLILLKILISVAAVNISSCFMKWNEITAALKVFFVPDIFIFVIDTTIKYIFILGELSLNLLYALKLRSVGRGRNKNASLSGIIGTVFIKSMDMAEDMQGAMECRGFTGHYKTPKGFKLKAMDLLVLAVDVLFILLFLKDVIK